MSDLEPTLAGEPEVPPAGEENFEFSMGRRLRWATFVVAVIGTVVMAYLQDFELTARSKYHMDLSQSPHWLAYHGESFPEDDLLVRYASYNESPAQNALYWIGTLFADIATINKLVSCLIFGLTAALFFRLLTSLVGVRCGILAAAFFMIFPRSIYEIGGGFSKAWATGFVLISVYVLERRAWKLMLWVMPVAALVYPVAPVLFGGTIACGLCLLATREFREALRGLCYLVIGSALALVPLLYKYLTPPEFIGEMISSGRLREMRESGMTSEGGEPLWEEVIWYFEPSYYLLGGIVVLILLGSKGPIWRQGWTALAIASVAGFLISQALMPKLYVPSRYTRFGIAVLLILWHAENWERVLERIRPAWLPWLLTPVLIIVVGMSFPDSFTPCDGDPDQGLWEDRGHASAISEAVAELPEPVLIVGHPWDTADIVVQARRPVLTINRMFHHWFDRYRATIDERHRDTFRAVYAKDPEEVNELVRKYGATHLVLRKSMFSRSKIARGKIYRDEYDKFILDLAGKRQRFALQPPPREKIIYENSRYWLVELPLEE